MWIEAVAGTFIAPLIASASEIAFFWILNQFTVHINKR